MALRKGGKPEVSRYRFYSEIQGELRTGDLVCWRVNNFNNFFTFILYLYHKFFKATFSHVAVILRFGDRLFAVEAVHPKVRLIPLHMLKNFYAYRLGIEERKSHIDVLLKHIGKKYSFFDLGKNMMAIRTTTDELFCSELAYDFYESIGFFEASTDEFDEVLITPDQLVTMVMERANVVAEFVKIDKGNINHAT